LQYKHRSDWNTFIYMRPVYRLSDTSTPAVLRSLPIQSSIKTSYLAFSALQ
jgi:hypothetical protein